MNQAPTTTLPPPTSPPLSSPPGPSPVPPAATTAAIPEAHVTPAPPLRIQAAAWLEAQGVGSRSLAVFGLVFAALSALVFWMHHPGLAGALGAVALVAGELSLVRAPLASPTQTNLARCLNPLLDLLLAAGITAGIASTYPLGMVALSLLVLVLIAWLPVLRASGVAAHVPPGAGLWRRPDRMGILLLGATMGRIGPALFVLVTILALDAWLRIERIDQPVALQPDLRAPFVQRIIRPDGSFVPAVRWATLGVTVVLLLAMPQSDLWRF